MMIKSRVLSFIVIMISYVLSFACAYASYGIIWGTPLLRMFIADIIATVIIWIIGIIFKNSSVYDPYWSVAPLVIILAWLVIRGGVPSLLDMLIVAAVYIWGIRLTLNWAAGFMGLENQDWRYTMYRKQNPKAWFWINLTGIHMMPTILVFGGMIPAYFSFFYPAKPNAIVIAGFLICLLAAGIQFTADFQLARFRKSNRQSSLCIEKGLWKYSRHPNYFGEVAFWWGIYIIQAGALPQYWYTVFGTLAISLLFILISIPMMEKHLSEKRPQYEDYKKRVSMLIPREPKA